MEKKNVVAGIIGCGGVAYHHVEGYKANDIKIAALADVNLESAKKIMDYIGYEVKIYNDSAALLDSGECTAVSICTPPVLHAEWVIKALNKGIHVLCEKPIADTLEAAEAIREAAHKSQAKFMMAFRHRFLDSSRKLKQLIESGEIGRPLLFHNEFFGSAFGMKDRWFCQKKLAGGGSMLDTSSHAVDLFRYLFGEIVEQHAVMNRYFENTDVEDSAILTVRSAGGVIGSMVSSFTIGSGNALITIAGDKGRAVYDYKFGDRITIYKGKDEPRTIPVDVSDGFPAEVALFVNAITEDAESPLGADAGVRAFEVIAANYR